MRDVYNRVEMLIHFFRRDVAVIHQKLSEWTDIVLNILEDSWISLTGLLSELRWYILIIVVDKVRKEGMQRK